MPSNLVFITFMCTKTVSELAEKGITEWKENIIK